MRILVAEDERGIAEFLARALEAEGFSTDIASDGESAQALALSGDHDLMLLDVMLPRRSGLDVLATVRRERPELPVIVLTALGQKQDVVAGLDGGADDYITKPFGAEELMARIRAALRHRLQQQGAERTFSSGDLSVDLVRRLVKRGAEDVKLSPKEYDILEQLVIHAGKVLTHKHLLREVWRDETVDPQYLRVYVRQLRQKVEADPSTPRHVLTEPGVGYRLV